MAREKGDRPTPMQSRGLTAAFYTSRSISRQTPPRLLLSLVLLETQWEELPISRRRCGAARQFLIGSLGAQCALNQCQFPQSVIFRDIVFPDPWKRRLMVLVLGQGTVSHHIDTVKSPKDCSCDVFRFGSPVHVRKTRKLPRCDISLRGFFTGYRAIDEATQGLDDNILGPKYLNSRLFRTALEIDKELGRSCYMDHVQLRGQRGVRVVSKKKKKTVRRYTRRRGHREYLPG